MVTQLRFVLVMFVGFACGLLSGCGSGTGQPATVLLSGVQGQATRGPITPLSLPGQPNEAPLPGAVIVVQRTNGAEVARQTADPNGNFRISISPGSYQIVGLPPNGGQTFPIPPGPQPVVVPQDQYVTVNVSYDTGIR